MTAKDVSLREGSPSDLQATFALSDRTMHRLAIDLGYLNQSERSDAAIAAAWARTRGLVEFLDAQEGRRYVIAENSTGPVAYARVVRFGEMEQLTDLMVSPQYQGAGIGRRLLEAIWPGGPSPSLGRIVIATGNPRDLSLYTDFGVMPVAGHWHMRQETAAYLGHRSQETDATEAGTVVVLTVERAVAEWKRLEPDAIGHERPALHECFGRDRACLATVDRDGTPKALCWVSTDGDIGPAVGINPGEVISVVLAALDRVAKTQEPAQLGIYASTTSWHLLHRLRMLGFRVYWPSWVMCSVPLPGLDRYVPTRPPLVL
ncbi:MAG TPA: GNAT family N-acetyltransferase [Thermoleophilaceae bacterium]